MGKDKKTEEAPIFEPRPDLGAAEPFTEKLQSPRSNFFDAASMLVVSLSFLGLVFAEPAFNLAALFMLYALSVNRGRGSSSFSQSTFGFVMVSFTTFFLYYRMTQGYAVMLKEARQK